MNKNGFTLVEVLVTITLFSVVILTIFGSFRAVFSSVDSVAHSSRIFESANACLNRMIIDLTSLHAAPYPLYKKPDIDDDGDMFQVKEETVSIGGQSYDRLFFTSFSHIGFNQSLRQGIAKIIYYADVADDDTLVLRRADHLFPYPEFEPDPNDPILCEHLQGIEFFYLDADGEIEDTWDSDADEFGYATPKAVGIVLKLGEKENPRVFKTMVSLPVFREEKE